MRIFLVGPMGSGKSTVGRILAKELSLTFIDTDNEIEKKAGASIDWIFEVEGEDKFRNRESEVFKNIVIEDSIVVATGGGIILTKENRDILKDMGVTVLLDTSIDSQLDRLKNDKKRPLLQTDSKREKLKQLCSERDHLYDEVSHIVINTDKQELSKITKEIIYKLNKYEC